jgi:glucose/arabinose dehydrogenase
LLRDFGAVLLPSGPAEDVVTGFLIDGDKARGRPVGLAVDGQGALLIADDTGNSVWRVSAAGIGSGRPKRSALA